MSKGARMKERRKINGRKEEKYVEKEKIEISGADSG